MKRHNPSWALPHELVYIPEFGAGLATTYPFVFIAAFETTRARPDRW